MRKIQIEVGFKTKILLWLLIVGLFFNALTNLLRPSTSTAQLGTTTVYVAGGSLDGIDGTVEVEGSVRVHGSVEVENGTLNPVHVDVGGTVTTCEICQ